MGFAMEKHFIYHDRHFCEHKRSNECTIALYQSSWSCFFFRRLCAFKEKA